MAPNQDRQAACARLAASQNGVLTTAQALEIGMSRSSIARLVSAGKWEWVLPRVLAPGPGNLSLEGRATAACFWAPGAAASHFTSARFWSLIDFDPDRVEITCPRHLRTPDGLITHYSPVVQAQEVRGVRMTTVARTLLDLASQTTQGQLEGALEEALRRRLTSLPTLERFVDQFGGRGRPGSSALRQIVGRYKELPTESHLERKVLALFHRHRFPQPITQYVINEGGLDYRVDFGYPSVRVGIEAHSFRWHTGRKSWSYDLKRLNALSRIGWTMLFITNEDVEDGGYRFFETLEALLLSRGFFAPRLPLSGLGG
jgi:very-short-patch-repair endonuclease